MNKCCEHLFREAKRELQIRDTRIAELQKECTRLFEPTREFWNSDTRSDLKTANSIILEIIAQFGDSCSYDQAAYEIRKVLDNHQDYIKKIGN